MLRNLVLMGLSSCLICTAHLSVEAQKNETDWFKDVTTTHVPLDGREHALDIVFLEMAISMPYWRWKMNLTVYT